MEPTGGNDAQRQALGSLLARFTADRDALLASIQGCQERIADLLSRLDAGVNPAPLPRAEPAPAGPGADELRRALERLRAEQETALDQIRADAAQAMDRADAALDAALGAARQTAGTDVRAFRAELADVRERVETLAAAVSAAATADALAEVRATIARVQDGVGRMESKMGDYVEANVRATAESGDAELATLRAEVQRLSARLSASERTADGGDGGAAIVELRGEIARVEASLTDRIEARLRFALDGWEQEARVLHEELRRVGDQRTRDASATAALADTRTAIQEVRADLERTRSATEERVEARLRAVTETWTAEVRLLRDQLAALVAGQSDHAALEAGLREVRLAIQGVRGDVGRMDAALDRRLEARLPAATGWDAEARDLHARVEALAAMLADRSRAEPSGLADAVAWVRTRMASVGSTGMALPGLRAAATAVLGRLPWTGAAVGPPADDRA